MSYASRLESLNSAIQSTNQHAQNVVNVVNDSGSTPQQIATGIINSVGGAVGSTAGIVSGVQHFRDFKRMGQNIFNRLNGQVNTNEGIKSATNNSVGQGGNDNGGTAEENANANANNSVPRSNANADNLGGGNAPNTANDNLQNLPQNARQNINEPSTSNPNAADDDLDGMSWDDLVSQIGGLQRTQGGGLSAATDNFLDTIGMGNRDVSNVDTGGPLDSQTQALNQMTNEISNPSTGNLSSNQKLVDPTGQVQQNINQNVNSGEDILNGATNNANNTQATLDASKIAQNGGGGASNDGGQAGNLISKVANTGEEADQVVSDTITAVADTGDAIMSGSAASGVAAPIVAVVGGLVSLGATIASAFEKKKKAPSPPPPPTSNQNTGTQIGGNLRQDQGDSGVGLY